MVKLLHSLFNMILQLTLTFITHKTARMWKYRLSHVKRHVCSLIAPLSIIQMFYIEHGRIQRGAGGPDPPPEKSQILRVSYYSGPDPLKNHKATKPEFNVGPSSAHQRNAI